MSNTNITASISRLEATTNDLAETVDRLTRKYTTRTDLPKEAGVYEIVVTETGEKYVGSAAKIRNRIQTHFSKLRHGKHESPLLQKAFDTYGEDAFSVAMIELIDDRETRLDCEQTYIDRADEFSLNTLRSSRGRTGMPHTEKTKEKMSASKVGELHPKFKGIYSTPWGEFTSPYAASLECPDGLISHSSIAMYCEKSPIINRATYGHSGYLQKYHEMDVIGMHWNEIGFSFTPATKH